MRDYFLEKEGDAARHPPSLFGSPGLVNCAISRRKASLEETRRFVREGFDDAPVVGYKVFSNDIVVIRKARNPEALTSRLEGSGPRGKITILSAKSRRRLAFIAANSPIKLCSFLTLTYPAEFPSDGKLVKRNLASILSAIRRRFPGAHYLWFLEFQKRGAPHIHAFFEIEVPLPHVTLRRKLRERDAIVNANLQQWASRRWFEIVNSGDEKHLRAGSCWEVVKKADGAARYVAKECSKTIQKWVPEGYQDVGRFWGTSRGFPPDDVTMEKSSSLDLVRKFGSEVEGPDGRIYPILHGKGQGYVEKAEKGTEQTKPLGR